MNERNKNSLGAKIFTYLIFLFLYLPIIVLIVFSFNDSKSRTVWSGFTFDWYAKLFHNDRIIGALQNTLLVSILAAVIATLTGTFAAIGFFNMKKKWRGPLLTINNIPMVNADIITGVSMSLLFVTAGAALGFQKGFATLLIAHISFDVPYIILSVTPKLYQLDRNVFEAAQDLGCTWFQSIYKVIIPEIMPGIINGFIIAFTMSIDDFVISYFAAGRNSGTLAMEIYAMTKRRISPEINAISAILFIVVLLLLITVNVREARQEKQANKKSKALKGANT